MSVECLCFTCKLNHRGLVVNEKIPQQEQQPGSSRPSNNLAESSNDESSDEEDHGTTY